MRYAIFTIPILLSFACGDDDPASSEGGGTGGTNVGGTSAGGTSAGGTTWGVTSVGGTSVGGTSAGGTTSAGTGSGDPDGFGSECTDDVDHSDCGAPADFCAKQPGSPTGICTATGCADDLSVCPEGWGCLDLSAFQPDLPAICTAPD